MSVCAFAVLVCTVHVLLTHPSHTLSPPPHTRMQDNAAALEQLKSEVSGLRFPLIVKHHNGWVVDVYVVGGGGMHAS